MTRAGLSRSAAPLAVLGGLALLYAVRPGVVENAARSPLAWAAVVGTVLAGVGVRAAATRLGARPGVARGLGTAVVAVVVVALLLPSFRQRTLVEELPAAALAPTSATAGPAAPPAAVTASPAPTTVTSAGPGSPRPGARPSPTAPVAAPPATAAPAPVPVDRVGSLRGVGHTARGTVRLRGTAQEAYLVFEGVDIEGTVGPSVHLVPPGGSTPKGGVRIGDLKAERGTFSYRLPAGVDVRRSWSVLVWCDPYDTPIAEADPR